MKRKFIMIILAVAVLIVAWIAFCGYQWSWGPFMKLHDLKTANLPGNAPEYGISSIVPVENSPLKGKTIVFLGSSVTYGASSMGVSFADDLGAKYDCRIVKEAVSGTTLVDDGLDSYVSRLEKLDTEQADFFVCQLSTNDATQKKSMGSISADKDISSFDTQAVAGAMEYIIEYANEKWNCPVYFYTNSHYDSEAYAQMVNLLPKLQEKWGIRIIDLWNDADFNDISKEQRALYMADAIHPTQAGYLFWWLPKFEVALLEQ